MDSRLRTIRTTADAEEMHSQILQGAANTAKWLRTFEGNPMAMLRQLRFDPIGCDPLTGQPLNIVEQLNQTFTILVSLRAVECLIEMHPEAEGFRVALGTCQGRDVESLKPGLVSAEVFSATSPNSNQKLKKDLARLAVDSAEHRYIFFACPGYSAGRHETLETSQVQIFAVEP